ncbi:MAG TPA: hypothetical protein VGG74_31520 [Kofleriaceae bacterium]
MISFVAACVSPRPSDSGPSFDSVRDRLTTGPTTMFVAATENAGALDAAHNTSDGWQSGSAVLSISSGAFVASLDQSDLLVASLDLSFDSIDVPPSVFGTPAQLTNVRLQLPTATLATATWSDADDAIATAPVSLSLSWSLATNGGVLQLGSQMLPALPLDVTLTGDGDSVTASLVLHGTGQLWTWADLLELTELDVSADAVTE